MLLPTWYAPPDYVADNYELKHIKLIKNCSLELIISLYEMLRGIDKQQMTIRSWK